MIKIILTIFLSINLYSIDMGYTLFQGNCVTCHNPTKSISAPSMVELRSRYLDAFPNKKDFVDYMSVWVKTPKEETSIMEDSIKKYGLMPNLAFSLDTTKVISNYIYKTDFSNK
jgi:hypothetical protein